MSKRKRAREAAPATQYHRDMLVADAVDADSRVKDVLHEYGLRCEECIVAEYETLAEGCAPLGLSVDDIVGRLNALDSASGGA